MAEQILMIVICAAMWVFAVGPALFCFIFENENISYKDAALESLAFTGFIIGVFLFVILAALCINFIGGDPHPITTLLDRLK